jgi:hypothetical protein
MLRDARRSDFALLIYRGAFAINNARARATVNIGNIRPSPLCLSAGCR